LPGGRPGEEADPAEGPHATPGVPGGAAHAGSPPEGDQGHTPPKRPTNGGKARTCGAKVRCGGRCESCGHQPMGELAEVRHKGICPLCGGGMKCRGEILSSNGRCRMHNGGNRVGPAVSTYKHGLHSRYTKLVADDIRRSYERAATDEELLSLRDDVALVQAKVNDAVKALSGKATTALFREMNEGWSDLKAAMRSGDPAQLQPALNSLERLIQQGDANAGKWDEVLALLDFKSKLAEREWRRQEALQTMITAEQARALFGAVVALIHQHVHDPLARLHISNGIHGLIGGPDRGRQEDDAGDT
jgi:hypothetical protein